MASQKLLVLALTIASMHTADGAIIKALQKRSLAAAGLPDPHCKTGIVSLDGLSCCAGYCGACNDYDTCKNVKGQDSENACCASEVYKMRCGNAPANTCLKTCASAVPPCIMAEDLFKDIPQITTHKGVPPCNKVVPFNRQRQAAAVKKGEALTGLHVATTNLEQAMQIVKAAQAKLQKDAKRADIPKKISTQFDAAIKSAEKAMVQIPNGISKVEEVQKSVAALKVDKEISHELEVKISGAEGAAEMELKDAKEVQQASESLHQEVLEHFAKKLAGSADKQADQFAEAQKAADAKKDAASKAAKVAADAKAKVAAAEAAAAKAKDAKAKAAASKEAADAKAAAAKAKAEAKKLQEAAEAAAAKAKKQEAEKEAAEVTAQKAAKKMCQSQLEGLPCGQEWAFVTDSKSNLVAIKKGPKTGSGTTEVHRLTAASNYKKYDLQTATALHLTDKNWDFVMDSKDNLVAILKGPKTGSGKTEVHRLSAASNYNSFDLQTGTGLQLTDENWAFTMDSKDNLVCVLKGPSGSGKTEVHRLTAASNYKSFNLHTATGLHYTNTASNKGDWDFAMDPQDNLVCILKGPSGSGKTEVHKLTQASNFNKFNLHTSTALHYSQGWDFAMAKNDVVAILKGPTSGSCMTEVHKLSGAANYGTYNLQVGTGLGLSGPTSCSP